MHTHAHTRTHTHTQREHFKNYTFCSYNLIIFMHTACSANNEMKRMVLIKTQVYLSLQKGGYQGKVFWVLDKPAVRERKSCDTEQTQASNAVWSSLGDLWRLIPLVRFNIGLCLTRQDLSHFLLQLISVSWSRTLQSPGHSQTKYDTDR